MYRYFIDDFLKSSRSVSVSLGAVLLSVVMIAAAANITYDFADKGQGINKYVEHISKLLKDGHAEEACQASRELIEAYDRYVKTSSKKTNEKGKIAAPSKELIRQNRKILALVRSNVLFSTGRITRSQWLEAYETMLKDDPKEANNILNTFLRYPENIFTPEMIDSLQSARIPAEAQQRLQKLVFDRKFPAKKPTDVIWAEFYEDMLVHKADVQKKKKLLNLYVYALHMRKEDAGIARALDGIIKLNANTELGVHAAKLRIACEVTDDSKDLILIKLVQEWSNTLLSSSLNDTYLISLARQKQYDKALQLIDEEHRLTNASVPEKAEIIKELVGRLCQIKPLLIADLNTQLATNDNPAAPSISSQRVFADLAGDFLEKKEYQTSVALSFAAMDDRDTLPLHLATGAVVTDASQIADVHEADLLAEVATYLAARAKYLAGDVDTSNAMLQNISTPETSQAVQPYALFCRAQIASARGDHILAVKLADQAQEILPDSPVLRTFIHVCKAKPASNVEETKATSKTQAK
ncbi:MAG: hypothetical protein JXA82_16505 [Sedimentisphaerales bacterium]|nr:hypothetical protein [Sedimentisphaerales bacterium]